MNASTLRALTRLLGAGTLAFGVVPFLSPRLFSSLFGLTAPSDPTTDAAFRSVGARDIALGVGLLTAAAHTEQSTDLAPWIMGRVICDAGDATATLIAISQGERNPRFLALSAAATGAAVFGGWLWFQARNNQS